MLNPSIILVLAVLTYVVAVDENVAPYLILQTKRLGLSAQRAIWMIRMHPEAPWTRIAINRRAWRLAEEMRQSFNLSDDKSEVG
jgi:hypothetical protein